MIALVPLKGFRDGKTRLSPVLDEDARGRLAFWMMRRVLRSLAEAQSVERMVLISKDVDAQSAAQTLGAESFFEESGDLNGALREAVALFGQFPGGPDAASGTPPEAVLIIPADVPLLKPEDVDAIAALGGTDAPCVVAAPSHRGEGTNALLLHPPDVLSPSFGTDSFNGHRAQAVAQGVAFIEHRSAGLGLDIDLPEDLKTLRGALDPKALSGLSKILASGPVVSP